jgi:outer membrane cobalamin receptor
MKLISVIFTLFCVQTTFGQLLNDTIKFEPFVIEELAVSATYKTTNLDAVTTKSVENLAQLLQENSTIFIKSYGSGSLASVSFRGTGAGHTRVLWNGVSLNSPMNGQIDFSLYPTPFFDKVELHYGASGLIDGNGALGGSVNLQNSLPNFNDSAKSVKLNYNYSIGSFSKQIHSGKVSYLGTNNWFYETRILHSEAENDLVYYNFSKKENPEERLQNAALKQYGFQQAIYKKVKNQTIGMRFWYFNSDRNLPSTMLVEKNDETQQDESFRLLINTTGFKNKISYKISSALIHDNLIYNNKLIDINSKNNSLLIDNHIDVNYFINDKITFLNKINIRHEQAKADGYNSEHKRFNNSWLTGFSGNLKRLNWTVFNRMTVVDDYFKPLAPSISLGYQLPKLEDVTLKVAAGINHNYPTFNDLYWTPGGNSDLKPEEAKMSEAGIKYHKAFGKTTIATENTFFFAHVSNWILWQPSAGNIWSPTNLKKVENKGFESTLTIKYKLNKVDLSIRGNYAYTISKNIDLPKNTDDALYKQLIYVPQHQFNANAKLTYKNTSLSYGYYYTGLRYISTDNNWYLPANYISNISLSQDIKLKTTSFNLRFQVNNLFNQTYQSIAWRPMPLRNYMLTLAFKL